MPAFVRQIVNGEEYADSESVEDVVAQAGDAEARAREFLVDDTGRRRKPGPSLWLRKSIKTRSTGTGASSGQSVATGTGRNTGGWR